MVRVVKDFREMGQVERFDYLILGGLHGLKADGLEMGMLHRERLERRERGRFLGGVGWFLLAVSG